MVSTLTARPDYGNYVSKKFIVAPGALGGLLLVLSPLLPILLIPAACFILIAAYFVYARHRFSAAGGNVQGQVQDLVVERLGWDGRGEVIDIGCGNAPLTIKLAHQYPAAQVTAIDYWGGAWEYSKGMCEANAQREGVAQRVSFQKASASALPFEDGRFDAAVSNLVFHEVADTADKRKLIREALRVVKPGGSFAFQDLFQVKRFYGNIDDLLTEVKRWGITRVEFVDTSNAAFIPGLLKLPFMVGAIGILYGQK